LVFLTVQAHLTFLIDTNLTVHCLVHKEFNIVETSGLSAEVGNVTSKFNGVTHHRLGHVLKAITLSSDDSSNFDSVITLRRGSYVPRAKTVRNNNFSIL
jgi:hypothetical protein